MASLKAEKPVGTQLFGQAKKEATPKASDGALKGQASKSASKKPQQKSQESNKKKPRDLGVLSDESV
ncbi:hypothetical protein TSUD_39770 [Trifolium subterraneum]|uniref:Uncharacterized protein n=1 Tax=Trifolium subterraneum TaxID=3900 RepID=A0A2Z6LYV0_TRISU|nr:hypothetical protein TSUD_39770 [Trifolium subterraneum]